MFIDTNGIEIGDKVRDQITGLEGIVTGMTQWTTGCARAIVQPPVDKENKVPDGISVDVLQLAVTKPGPRHGAANTTKGGPRPTPTRR
jgi:hypothetical protein